MPFRAKIQNTSANDEAAQIRPVGSTAGAHVYLPSFAGPACYQSVASAGSTAMLGATIGDGPADAEAAKAVGVAVGAAEPACVDWEPWAA